MEVTFSSEESSSIIMAGMESEGFSDIDPKTLEVSVKSLRDGSGNNQITCSFKKKGSTESVAPPTEQEEQTETEDQTTIGLPDNSNSDRDTSGDDSVKAASIFDAS